MAELIPCSEYDSKTNSCRSGHARLHPICRGVVVGSICPACGSSSSPPMCMQDDQPAHLIRDDGMPVLWKGKR